MVADERIVVVTGGASGIGRETSLLLGAQGAVVVIADTNETDGPLVAEDIRDAGGQAAFLRTEVSNEGDVCALAGAIRERYGRLYALVTAAGILRGAYTRVEDLDTAIAEQVMSVNFLGTFLCCKHLVPLIEEGGGGVLVLIASGAGVRGGSSSVAYGASKGAVNGLGLVLIGQLEPRGIRVNIVCPGNVDTPLKRENVREGAVVQGRDPSEALHAAALVDPRGIAKVLAFLVSDDGAMIRGQIFTR